MSQRWFLIVPSLFLGLMALSCNAHAKTWTCDALSSNHHLMQWTVSGSNLMGRDISDLAPRQNEQHAIVKNDSDVLAAMDKGLAGEVDVIVIDKTMRRSSRYSLFASREIGSADQLQGNCWRSR